MSLALIFPGQGSQKIGMGLELATAFPEAKHVFQEVDDALGQNLSKLIFDGYQFDLDMTENTQPAIMATSIAALRVLEKQGNFNVAQRAKFVAGHSLGEYAALAAAGVFDVPTAAKLLRIRGSAMQQAVPVGIGAMAALLGADLDGALEICKLAAEKDIVTVANDNAPGQVVISGHVAAVDRAIALAAERGIKKAIKLPVSAPFHCPLMQPAAEAIASALAKEILQTPSVPVVANVTATAETQTANIQKYLVEQVTGMVRWRESADYMAQQGVTTMLELGAGKVLAGLVKRIAPDVTVYSFGTPADIDAYLEKM